MSSRNVHLFIRNSFAKEDELSENNSRSDCNFGHLIKADTVHCIQLYRKLEIFTTDKSLF